MEKLNLNKIDDPKLLNNAIKHQSKNNEIYLEKIDETLNDLKLKLFSSQLEFKKKRSYFRNKTQELLDLFDHQDTVITECEKKELKKENDILKIENEKLKQQIEDKDRELKKFKEEFSDNVKKFSFVLDHFKSFLSQFNELNNSNKTETILNEINTFKNIIEKQDLDSIKKNIELKNNQESNKKVNDLKNQLENSKSELKKELKKFNFENKWSAGKSVHDKFEFLNPIKNTEKSVDDYSVKQLTESAESLTINEIRLEKLNNTNSPKLSENLFETTNSTNSNGFKFDPTKFDLNFYDTNSKLIFQFSGLSKTILKADIRRKLRLRLKKTS